MPGDLWSVGDNTIDILGKQRNFDILRVTSNANSNRRSRCHISILWRNDRSLASIRGYRESGLALRGNITARLYGELCELVRIVFLSFEIERTSSKASLDQ